MMMVVFQGGPWDGIVRSVERAVEIFRIRAVGGDRPVHHVYLRGSVVANATVYHYHGLG